MTSEKTLIFKDVTVRYHDKSASVLSGITMGVSSNERVALFGLNGSGKTTLLLAATGLLPFTGRIVVDGIELTKKTADTVRDRIGFLFSTPEDQILFPRVIDDTAFSLTRRKIPVKEAHARAHDALARLGAADLADKSPFQLSHGQRQRVALAGALVAAPPLLLLDEPSSAHDPAGKRSLAVTLSGINAAMLVATHDIPFAASVCSRYVLLNAGKTHSEGVDFKKAELCLDDSKI